MSNLKKPRKDLFEVTAIAAGQLDEKNPQAIATLNRAIQVAGLEAVCHLVEEAKAAHASADPPMVKNGSRPRTLGGCFFELLRSHLTKSGRRRVFPIWSSKGQVAARMALQVRKVDRAAESLERTPG